MKDLLSEAADFVRSLPGRVARAKKAAVPLVTGLIGLISIPTLGVDPELVAGVVLLASTLGVYRAKNAPPVA